MTLLQSQMLTVAALCLLIARQLPGLGYLTLQPATDTSDPEELQANTIVWCCCVQEKLPAPAVDSTDPLQTAGSLASGLLQLAGSAARQAGAV